ncbi:MAG: InlB B-repeat-containing protein [Firmicutes bacterium]|nr:InlB B-repeat-containing protein [Bacillota bacterium]
MKKSFKCSIVALFVLIVGALVGCGLFDFDRNPPPNEGPDLPPHGQILSVVVDEPNDMYMFERQRIDAWIDFSGSVSMAVDFSVRTNPNVVHITHITNNSIEIEATSIGTSTIRISSVQDPSVFRDVTVRVVERGVTITFVTGLDEEIAPFVGVTVKVRELPIPVREGYEFAGWIDSWRNSIFDPDWDISGHGYLQLYAVWFFDGEFSFDVHNGRWLDIRQGEYHLASSWGRYYINRNDGRGFVFNENTVVNWASGIERSLPLLSSFGFESGQYALRFMQNNNIVRNEKTNVGYIERVHLNITVDTNESNLLHRDYSFDFQGNGFRIDGTPIGTAWYRVYVDNDGQGLVFRDRAIGHSIFTFNALAIQQGQVTVRAVAEIANYWHYADGKLYFGRSYGEWQFEVTHGEIEREYEFSVGASGNVLWASVDFRRSESYRVYVRTGTESNYRLASSSVNSGTATLNLLGLGLRTGDNVIRVRTTGSIWHYSDGVLNFGVSIGRWEVDAEINDTAVLYEFLVVNNGLVWNGALGVSYRVYTLSDGEWVFRQNVSGGSAFSLRTLIDNDADDFGVRVVRIANVTYVDDTLSVSRNVASWNVDIQRGEMELEFDWEWVGNSIRFGGANAMTGTTYRIYSKNIQGQFVLRFNLSANSTSQNFSFNIIMGQNTIRAVSAQFLSFELSGDTIRAYRHVSYWSFYS